MDEYYDMKDAAARVEKWGDLLAAPENEDYAITVVAANIDVRKISIQKRDFPLAWVAVALNPDILRAEVCISMVGVLRSRLLPPVKQGVVRRGRERFAAQEAAIVGFNEDNFLRGISKVQDIVRLIVYDLPGTGEIDSDTWLEMDNREGLGPKVASSCRYFTSGHRIPAESKADFDKYVDPHEVLKKMQTEYMAHCYENEVSYMHLVNDKLETKDPAGFMEGDVVELGFSLQGFKKGADGGVVRLIMRSLTLLDRETSQKASLARRQARKPIERPIQSFTGMLTAANRVDRKKRTLHLSDSEDEGLPSTRRRMQIMNLDENDTAMDTKRG